MSVSTSMVGGLAGSPAMRAVATAFLRRRPWIVAPMLLLFVATVAVDDGPAVRLGMLITVGAIALGVFGWEAWRARTRLVSPRGLFTSLLLTQVGIGVGSAATGGTQSPLVFMLFAPAVVGFAAFGRSRASNVLALLAVGLLVGLALLPVGVPFPPLGVGARRFLVVVCAADALVLLRLGVAALTDAHAVASAAAEGAGDELAAAAAARAASVEAMGAKVAHEVRNPLSAIRGLVELLAEKATEERDRQRLSVVLGEVGRIDEILRGYLTLARPLDSIERRPHDVGEVLRETVAVVEARAARAGVLLFVEGDAPLVHDVDPRRLKEAVLNLVLNAIDATPAGGRVHLRAIRATDGVVITVEDSGAGMDAERLALAGRPFATGRPEGTGLGLALARQAAQQHGGALELESTPGRGTVARLRLPVGEVTT